MWLLCDFYVIFMWFLGSNSAYKQSKAANRMLTKKLSQIYSKDNIYVYTCHPGVTSSNVLTGLGFGFAGDSSVSCSRTPIYLAMSNDVKKKDTGSYYKNSKKQLCEFSGNQKNVDTLWQFCKNYL